jgi:polyphosphate kinase
MQTTHAEGARLASPKLSTTQTASAPVDLDAPSLYLNREISWLQFNRRVLEEALDEHRPLLERVKFLAIFARNLDEFFMIRVSGLLRQVTEGILEVPPDGLRPLEQLTAIRHTVMTHLARHAECWHDDVVPQLRAAGIHILQCRALQSKQRAFVARWVARNISPVLTPLALDLTPLPPPISNLSLNLVVVVRDPLRGECFAQVKVEDVCPRLLCIPDEDRVEQCAETDLREIVDDNFVWLEDVVAAHLDMLLPGVQVAAAYPFRVTRDANLEIKDDAAADLLTTTEEQVGMRHFGTVVRLEVDRTMPEAIRAVLIQHLQLAPHQVYTVDGPLGMASLMELTRLHRPDLQDAPFLPALPGTPVHKTADLFGLIRRHDLLLYHPYDSFMPVVDFVRAAAYMTTMPGASSHAQSRSGWFVGG